MRSMYFSRRLAHVQELKPLIQVCCDADLKVQKGGLKPPPPLLLTFSKARMQ